MQHVYLCLVQGGLFRREGAIGRYFRFVRQVGNQRRICLHSAQDEGAHQASQRGIAAFQGTGEGFEAFSAAQQPRIQKFHQAPEFIQVIFHRRAGQGYASFPMQGTNGAGTGGACVLIAWASSRIMAGKCRSARADVRAAMPYVVMTAWQSFRRRVFPAATGPGRKGA